MLGSFFGRFGDTKPRKQYAPQEIGGTHKFKKKEAPAERFDEPVPEKEWEFWELPKVYTFREWHNYWRQYAVLSCRDRIGANGHVPARN